MAKTRYNIWMDRDLIDQVKQVARPLGLKTATFMRMAILDMVRRYKDGPHDKMPVKM